MRWRILLRRPSRTRAPTQNSPAGRNRGGRLAPALFIVRRINAFGYVLRVHSDESKL
jgi:hypothetical protein